MNCFSLAMMNKLVAASSTSITNNNFSKLSELNKQNEEIIYKTT